VCLPHAGGGALGYRQFTACFPEEIEVCAIELPGRGTRMNEPLVHDFITLVSALAEAIAEYTDLPFAIFGHSMGALLAYELNRGLMARYGRQAQHLYVSGMRAPHIPDRHKFLNARTDTELMCRVRELGGIPADVWNNQDLVQMMTATMKADFSICASYEYQDHEPEASPITAFAGTDDPFASVEEVRLWRRHTCSGFAFKAYPGAHFFIHQAYPDVARLICSHFDAER
jgi:surfactin synthase thioesterase subunit